MRPTERPFAKGNQSVYSNAVAGARTYRNIYPPVHTDAD